MAFHGSVALVTGAGSGMGQIATGRLVAAGAKVAALDLNEAGLAKTEADGKGAVSTYVCDVSDYDAVVDTVAKVEKDLGPIDRTTHAAAIMPTAPVLDMDVGTFHKLMRVNFDGTVHVVKATLPQMVERKKGDVILFGSLAGDVLAYHFAAYSATKSAVNTFAEILIRENRNTGVRILLVKPPMTKTPLIEQTTGTSNPKSVQLGLKQNRMADPHEMVDMIETEIEKGTEILVPKGEAKALWRLRRFAPNVLWWMIHKAEYAT